MSYRIIKEILCEETGKNYIVGDIVGIKLKNGGGMGGCQITKITQTGFHYNQGGKDKAIQFSKIEKLY